jgi:hypothetical protein
MFRSPETALIGREPTWPHLWQWLVRQSRVAIADLRNIPRYVLRASIGVALVCGLLSLWGLHGDGPMPSMSALCGLDPYRISTGDYFGNETDAESHWNGLSPALAILDRVNPTVAKWVRDKHDSGLVVFGDKCPAKPDSGAALAKYDVFRDRIVVNRELFCENDGTIAATLCHEYRHSRQNLGKYCQYVLSFLFVRGGDPSIIENDAVIYEQEAHNNIFGSGKSSEKEVAAWEAAVRLQNQAGAHGRMSPMTGAVVAKRLP